MNDNDKSDGPRGPIDRTGREISADADLKRRMKVILPLLDAFLQRLNSQIDTAVTSGEKWDFDALVPATKEALTAEYLLWRKAANDVLAIHWNQYEQGLTAAEREEQLPHAAEDFAEEILIPSEREAIRDFLETVEPRKTVREGEKFYEALEKIRIGVPTIDTNNVTSFAQRSIKRGNPGDLPDH